MPSAYRLLIILALFLSTFVGISMVGKVHEVPIKKSLTSFPEQIGEWRRVSQRDLSEDVISLLGVNDYINYNYQLADDVVVNVYISYFSAVGVTGEYHSPRNCLPGGGWQIASVTPLPLKAMDQEGERDFVIQSMMVHNGAESQRTLYWYQNRGRIIASEYWEKFYLVWDAIFKQRRDGSFVRIMYPWHAGDSDGVDKKVEEFAASLIAILEEHIPGENID